MDFTDFGWRDGLVLAIVLAAVYLVVALLGLARLRRRHEQSSLSEAAHDSLGPPTQPLATGAGADDTTGPMAAASPFAAQLVLTELEAEVRQLRAEVSALHEELAAIKAARRVSPLYADAAALAKRGFDARGVANECGISVAEAELVMAMSRDDKNFDSEVGDGGHGDARKPSGR